MNEFLSNLICRIEHIKMHEQHRGHESMHAEMVFILLITLTVMQIILVEWKKRHFKTYQVKRLLASQTDGRLREVRTGLKHFSLQLVTLIALWIIPFGISLKSHWWRFIFLWLLSSCITSLVVRKAIQKPIEGTTPR